MPVTINGTTGVVTATSYSGAGGDLTGITTGKVLQVQETKITDVNQSQPLPVGQICPVLV